MFNQRTVVSISQSTINRLRTSSKLELLTCLSYTSFVPIKPMFRIETQTKIKITEQNQHLFQWPQKQIAEREIARLVIFWLAHKCSFVRIETRVSFLIISYHHIKIRVVVANWSRRYGPRCVCADHTSGFYTNSLDSITWYLQSIYYEMFTGQYLLDKYSVLSTVGRLSIEHTDLWKLIKKYWPKNTDQKYWPFTNKIQKLKEKKIKTTTRVLHLSTLLIEVGLINTTIFIWPFWSVYRLCIVYSV